MQQPDPNCPTCHGTGVINSGPHPVGIPDEPCPCATAEPTQREPEIEDGSPQDLPREIPPRPSGTEPATGVEANKGICTCVRITGDDPDCAKHGPQPDFDSAHRTAETIVRNPTEWYRTAALEVARAYLALRSSPPTATTGVSGHTNCACSECHRLRSEALDAEARRPAAPTQEGEFGELLDEFSQAAYDRGRNYSGTQDEFSEAGDRCTDARARLSSKYEQVVRERDEAIKERDALAGKDEPEGGPMPPFETLCAECGREWGEHCGEICPNERTKFRPAPSAPAEPEAEAESCNAKPPLCWCGHLAPDHLWLGGEKPRCTIAGCVCSAFAKSAALRAPASPETEEEWPDFPLTDKNIVLLRRAAKLALDKGEWNVLGVIALAQGVLALLDAPRPASPAPTAERDFTKPDPNCKACHGEGSYWEDVAGDGRGSMQVSCDCFDDGTAD